MFSGVGGKIDIGNYTGFSSHCSIWTATEDFINPTLTSPSLNKEYTKTISGDVIFDESVKIGTHCVFLPNTHIGFGASIAANTIVGSKIKEGSIIGPKSRHFKLYGYRNINRIKELKEDFENEN